MTKGLQNSMYKVIVVKGQSQEIITRTCNTIDEAINVFEGCAGGYIEEITDEED